jgi:hypothetical protein
MGKNKEYKTVYSDKLEYWGKKLKEATSGKVNTSIKEMMEIMTQMEYYNKNHKEWLEKK